MRANFMAELAPYVKNGEVSRSEAYLIGMFSTLEALLDVPLAEALEALNLQPAVSEALLHRSGPAGKLYDLILNYEGGDLVMMSNDADALGISGDVISQKYTECTKLVNNMRAGLLDTRS